MVSGQRPAAGSAAFLRVLALALLVLWGGFACVRAAHALPVVCALDQPAQVMCPNVAGQPDGYLSPAGPAAPSALLPWLLVVLALPVLVRSRGTRGWSPPRSPALLARFLL